ncbi:RNase adapter RapZ [Lysobacter soyae]|uniref:RNase adapter RapZ n=1 Tax=Lysobacter soyae TaxID=2764185 RepID=A0ABX8WLU8_9GAMM|nr:RNase adapter RapZ [Lysobacter sp. CJ11]QYR52615.1 RNase adapter RapZ [Lysobacter sp. CJ11]
MSAPALRKLIIVSGMSGSGKTVALRTLEDLGFHCADNLPLEMLPQWVEHSDEGDEETPVNLAVSLDVRSRGDLARTPELLSSVGRLGFDPKLVFFDASNEFLLTRYADTRRRHPLSKYGLALADAITLERQVLKPLSALADIRIDTGGMNVHQLRREVITAFALSDERTLSLLFESFAYRRGIPGDADFVFDARMLPNPHWDAVLRPLSGRDAEVRQYFESQPDVGIYLDQIRGFLDTWLPKMETDTRSYVTVAFGCSGGRHRSVYLAEQLARHARETGWQEVATYHRELE